MITIRVDTKLCKGCSLCVVNCPKDVLEMSTETSAKGYNPSMAVRPEDCIFCHICERICPDQAISVRKED
jgi:2-oxoglutarate ferredoxin oxidoreductase subunit delta